MLRASLKHFLRRKKKTLSQDVIDQIDDLLNENDFHKFLRNQIIMNPIPKRIKKDQSADGRRPHEVYPLRSASLQVSLNFNIYVPFLYLFKMACPSSMAPAGVLLLERVDKVLKLMGIKPENVKLRAVNDIQK